jgi:hypothetical protein
MVPAPLRIYLSRQTRGATTIVSGTLIVPALIPPKPSPCLIPVRDVARPADTTFSRPADCRFAVHHILDRGVGRDINTLDRAGDD